jgi:hypothetical protein
MSVVFLPVLAGELDNSRHLSRPGDEPDDQENDRENRVRVQLPVDESTDQETHYRGYSQKKGDRRQETRLADDPVAVFFVFLLQGVYKRPLKDLFAARSLILRRRFEIVDGDRDIVGR